MLELDPPKIDHIFSVSNQGVHPNPHRQELSDLMFFQDFVRQFDDRIGLRLAAEAAFCCCCCYILLLSLVLPFTRHHVMQLDGWKCDAKSWIMRIADFFFAKIGSATCNLHYIKLTDQNSRLLTIFDRPTHIFLQSRLRSLLLMRLAHFTHQ